MAQNPIALALNLLQQCPVRKTLRKERYVKRFTGICAKDRFDLMFWKKRLLFLLLLRKRQLQQLERDEPRILKLSKLCQLLALRCKLLTVHIDTYHVELFRTHISIYYFEQRPHLCDSYFRFCANELRRLYNVYRIPDEVIIGNRCKFTGEEIFLLSLHRYSYPKTYLQQVELFGREITQLCRAFSWFNNHMYNTFADKLLDNLEFWSTYFEDFCRAIHNKLSLHGYTEDPLTDDIDNIVGFVDGTYREICRPGSGPTANGGRKDPLIQRAFYSG